MDTQPTVFTADTQKIAVTLSEYDVFIEPGSVAQLVVTMTNQQAAPDRLSLEVEGVDVEWYMIPVAAVNVAPGAQASERIVFKIARNSENRAGTYPFLVRVQAMESGEVSVAQATLVVKPFSSLQVELTPKRGLATFFHPLNDFEVSIANLGNAEETLELYADDPEDEGAYEFDMERVTLKAGQSATVPLAMRPKSSTVLGGGRLIGFSVTVRSAINAYVSTKAHGQLEKRALISPFSGIFLLLLIFGGLATWAFWPRPPIPVVLENFNVSQNKVDAGKPVTLSWDVSGKATKILIRRIVGKNNPENNPGEQEKASGSVTVYPEAPQTKYQILVRGEGGQKAKEKEVTVVVNPPPPAPKPVIDFFTATPDKIHQGESLMLTWKTKGTDRLILDPGNIPMSAFEQSRSVNMLDQDTTFTLRAFSTDPKMKPAEKSVTIKVVSPAVCIAEILSFKPASETVYIGDSVRLRWATKYARSVRIESDRFPPFETESPRAGSRDFRVEEPTTFRIIVADTAGKTVEKEITVTPKPRPVEPKPVDDGTTDPATLDGRIIPPPAATIP